MTMRVLHVVESMKPEAGSAAICLRGLFDALRAREIGSTVATSDGYVETAGEKPSDASRCQIDRQDITGLAKIADVVHIHGWGYALARSLAIAARKLGKPYAISPYGTLCHGAYHKRSWRDRIKSLIGDNRLRRAAAAVTALNEVEERGLRACAKTPLPSRERGRGEGPIRRGRIFDCSPLTQPSPPEEGRGLSTHVLRDGTVNANIVPLPLGITADEYSDDRNSPQPSTSGEQPRQVPQQVLLMLGPIHPAEGCVPLLKAFAEIGAQSDGWNIVLAGQEVGDWRKMLEAAIRRKGGEDRVLFAPAHDLAAQRESLGRASALATLALGVRCPASLMQAVASGVPVLATDCVAPSELRDVIRVCRPTRDELKAGLRSLFELSEEGRTGPAQRAREVARKVFDWSVLVDRYIQFYQSLL